MVDNDMPGAWPVWTPGAPLAAFIKEYYTLVHTTYESSGPYGFGEEDFFYVFPMTPPGRGPYGPHGHSWQDL